MPNHVHHKITILGDNADRFILEMKMRKPDGSKVDGPFDLDIWCPSKKPWDYDDAIATHNTKWNAYDQTDWTKDVDGSRSMVFQTAWSTPHPIWEAIAEQHPDVHMEVWYADEDTGANLGQISIEDGMVDWIEMSDDTPEDQIDLVLSVIYPEVEWRVTPRNKWIYDAEHEEEYLEDDREYND